MKNKYKAIKSNGYDSRKENKRANELKFLEQQKIISDLREQVKFELVASFKDSNGQTERGVSYTLDFIYYDNEKKRLVAEDVKGTRGKERIKIVNGIAKKIKGFSTADKPEYIIKRKLFKLKYPQYLFLET